MAEKPGSGVKPGPYAEDAVNQHKRMAATGKPRPGNGSSK